MEMKFNVTITGTIEGKPIDFGGEPDDSAIETASGIQTMMNNDPEEWAIVDLEDFNITVTPTE